MNLKFLVKLYKALPIIAACALATTACAGVRKENKTESPYSIEISNPVPEDENNIGTINLKISLR
jgi:hypothetical protein